MPTEPKLKPFKERLRARLMRMPVPSIIDMTDAEWIPSIPWIRKVAPGKFGVSRREGRFFLFKIGK